MPTSKITVQFPCPVERVWQTVTDLAHTTWRSDLTAKHWWMRPFVPGYLKRQQRLYLDDLRQELQK